MTTASLHPELAAGRWFEMTLVEQLANIGSEVGRAARAKEAGNERRSWNALERALELFDLTIGDVRWRGREREICRAREVVCDLIVGDNACRSTADSLDAYFLPFALASRRGSPPHDAQVSPADQRLEQELRKRSDDPADDVAAG